MSPRSDRSAPGGADVNHGIQAWGFIFLFGFMLPAMAIQALVSAGGSGWLVVAGLVPAPLAWWLLAEARLRLRVSERGLQVRRLWKEPRRISWNDVEAVGYRPTARVLVLRVRGLDEGTLNVSLLRENVAVLARLIRDKLPESALEGAARELFHPSQ